MDPLIKALREQAAEDWNDEWDMRDSFDATMDTLLPELEDAERAFMSEHTLAVAQVSAPTIVHNDTVVSTPAPVLRFASSFQEEGRATGRAGGGRELYRPIVLTLCES